jgi:NAD(P)-dependent dehydrogenase (short-subunit alcohol dehydrogenase family)
MLKGRCALITGSTQGLGYGMAERLAAEGCNIVMNGFGERTRSSRRREGEVGSVTRGGRPSGADITGSAIPIDGGRGAD